MEAQKFKIESNVETSKNYKKRGRTPKYDFPFSTMKINDSFMVTKNTKTVQSYLINRANNFCKSQKLDWKFSTIKTSDGYRVYRIK